MGNIFIFLSGFSFGFFATITRFNSIIDPSLNELGMLLSFGIGVLALLLGIKGIDKNKKSP